jgi:dolichol-phosphate mannosyltransferase
VIESQSADTDLTVVLPLLNEGAILRALVAQVAETLDKLTRRWSILLVNDGSTDESACIIDQLASQDARIRGIHLSRNFGHAAAVRAGLDSADGRAVIVMDSDGQDDPKAIIAFVEKWREGADVVYATRFQRKEALWKRALFSGFYRVLEQISSVPIPRDAGNFGLMDRRVVDQIKSLPECDRYLPGLRSWVGFRQTSVMVERLARHDGKPRVRLRGLVSLAKTALFGFSRVPLNAFYALALLSGIVSLASIGYATYHKVFTGLAIPGWASVTSVSAFFGSINALGIAILGEYVARIYDQVRGRPTYVIARHATAVDAIQSFYREFTPNDEAMILDELSSVEQAVHASATRPPHRSKFHGLPTT